MPKLPSESEVRANAWEAKVMTRSEIYKMRLRTGKLEAHTESFPGVAISTVFVTVYGWTGTSKQWNELTNYALSNGFCVEKGL